MTSIAEFQLPVASWDFGRRIRNDKPPKTASGNPCVSYRHAAPRIFSSPPGFPFLPLKSPKASDETEAGRVGCQSATAQRETAADGAMQPERLPNYSQYVE
jgi:hypothetical protein